MLKKYWIKCPICNGKTRVQVFHNTVLKDFPLFCPKCKLTHIIDVEKLSAFLFNIAQKPLFPIIEWIAGSVLKSPFFKDTAVSGRYRRVHFYLL